MGWRVICPTRLLDRFSTAIEHLETDVVGMRNIYDNHAGVQDRFRETGILTQEMRGNSTPQVWLLERRAFLMTCGSDCPWPPYDKMNVKVSMQTSGDVAARVAVRFDEILESLRSLSCID